MATELIRLSGLARRLVMDGFIDEATAQKAQNEATESKRTLVSHLVTEKIVPSLDLAQLASNEFGMPLLDINAVDIDIDTFKLVDPKLISLHRGLPISKRGNQLFIAQIGRASCRERVLRLV